MGNPALIHAAHELVASLDLAVVESAIWRAGHRMRIAYPRAPDAETAYVEMALMVERLIADGWCGDPRFRSHGVALVKQGVHAVLRPQNSSVDTRNIELTVHRPDH